MLLLVSSLGVLAQNTTLSGTILNEETKEPIEFVNVVVQGTESGASTDRKGQFSISFHPDYGSHLHISYLGFENKVVTISELTTTENLVIYLKPKVYQIGGVTVRSSDGQKIVKEAISRMKDNYPQGNYSTQAFYRQYHQENGEYVRLIEANLTLFHKGRTPFNMDTQQETVAINHLRRSHNFEINDELHGDHLIDLLMENSVKYNTGTALNDRTLKRYNYALDSLLYVNDELAFQISYETNYLHGEKLEKGKMIIDYATYGILQIDAQAVTNEWPNDLRPGGTEKFTWEFKESEKHIKFKKYKGKLYLEELTMEYEHDLYSNQFNSLEYTIVEKFELYTDSISTTFDEQLLKENRPKKWTNLYHAPYEYDEQFWENYQTPAIYPLPEEVATDLEKYKTLEAQYHLNSK